MDELIAQCRAHPDDPAPWAVLVDALIAAGDPRGEYAALVVAGKRDEAAPLYAAFTLAEVALRHGFVVGACPGAATELATFLASPLAAFLERLIFRGVHSITETLAAVAASPLATEIRTIRFDDRDLVYTPVGAEAMLPSLAQLTNLHTLVLPGGYDLIELVEALPAQVVHLGLIDDEDGEDMLDVLVASPTLRRLVSLDLSGCILAVNSAAMIVEHAAAFAHLERLALDDCYFTEADVARITAVLPRASCLNQKSYDAASLEDASDRYLVMGE